jgi:F-type H+-transporting ATPase subunit b
MKIEWWTLALQTINVVILLWILQRFLFKPVQAVIAQRQQQAQKLTNEANAARLSAEQERATLANERSMLATERERALSSAQAEAQQAGAALLEQAETQAREHTAAAQAALQRERRAVEAAQNRLLATLAGDMARHLLERLPNATWNRHFIDDACASLTRLAPSEYELLHNADRDDPIQVVSADALSEADQAALRAALQSALGHDATLEYTVDPSLLAGVELRFRHLVVRNHWASDLKQLTAKLQRDDDPA